MIAYPNIDPIAFSLGPLSFRWYGLAYVTGFVLFIVLGKYRARTRQIPLTVIEIDDLMLYAMIGLIVGARLGEIIFYYPNYYLANPLEIIKVWRGGMSFHGGLIGVIIGLLIFAKKNSLNPFLVFDAIVPLCPPGLFFGRIANFINAELIGRPTAVSWGMIFPNSDGLVRHPSQLYQAFFEGLLLFIILWFFSRIPKAQQAQNLAMVSEKAANFHPRKIIGSKALGMTSGLFLLLYGIFRFIVEFTRTPDTFMGYYPLGLSMGQFLNLPMMAIGGYLIFTAKTRQINWENTLLSKTNNTNNNSAKPKKSNKKNVRKKK